MSEIESVIISHGYYNHIGGLPALLQLNNKAKIYLKKETLYRKFNNGEKKKVLPFDLEKYQHRLVFVSKPVEIDEGIFIMPDIPIRDESNTNFQKCKVEIGEKITNDEFSDELFIAITRKNKLSILSSCSHRGITNVIRVAKEHFNLPIKLILGGFHFKEIGA